MSRPASRILLAAFPVSVVCGLALIGVRVLAARPDRVWALALLPVAALVLGPRTRVVVAVALCELAALIPLHQFVTLVRAARLEGG